MNKGGTYAVKKKVKEGENLKNAKERIGNKFKEINIGNKIKTGGEMNIEIVLPKLNVEELSRLEKELKKVRKGYKIGQNYEMKIEESSISEKIGKSYDKFKIFLENLTTDIPIDTTKDFFGEKTPLQFLNELRMSCGKEKNERDFIESFYINGYYIHVTASPSKEELRVLKEIKKPKEFLEKGDFGVYKIEITKKKETINEKTRRKIEETRKKLEEAKKNEIIEDLKKISEIIKNHINESNPLSTEEYKKLIEFENLIEKRKTDKIYVGVFDELSKEKDNIKLINDIKKSKEIHESIKESTEKKTIESVLEIYKNFEYPLAKYDDWERYKEEYNFLLYFTDFKNRMNEGEFEKDKLSGAIKMIKEEKNIEELDLDKLREDSIQRREKLKEEVGSEINLLNRFKELLKSSNPELEDHQSQNELIKIWNEEVQNRLDDKKFKCAEMFLEMGALSEVYTENIKKIARTDFEVFSIYTEEIKTLKTPEIKEKIKVKLKDLYENIINARLTKSTKEKLNPYYDQIYYTEIRRLRKEKYSDKPLSKVYEEAMSIE